MASICTTLNLVGNRDMYNAHRIIGKIFKKIER